MSCEIVKINSASPQPELVEYVVRSIDHGKMVGLPTDTFYGLAVDPINLSAVESIYELKRRARNKPLSLMIDEMAQAYELARDLDGRFDRLAEKFWPGPLTLIVKASSRLPLRVTANTGNVALRVPAAEIPARYRPLFRPAHHRNFRQPAGCGGMHRRHFARSATGSHAAYDRRRRHLRK